MKYKVITKTQIGRVLFAISEHWHGHRDSYREVGLKVIHKDRNGKIVGGVRDKKK